MFRYHLSLAPLVSGLVGIKFNQLKNNQFNIGNFSGELENVFMKHYAPNW